MATANSSNGSMNISDIEYDAQLEALIMDVLNTERRLGLHPWKSIVPRIRLQIIKSLDPSTFSQIAVNFLAYVERRAVSLTQGIPYELEDRFAEALALCILFPEGSHEITSNWMNQPILARYEFLMKLRDIRHTAIVDFIIAHYRRIMTRNLLARQAEEAEIAERAQRQRIENQQAEADWASLYGLPHNQMGGSKGSNKRRGGTRHSTHYKKCRTHRKRHTQRKY